MVFRRMTDILHLHSREPFTLLPDVTVQEACQGMCKHKVGAVLVTDALSRLIGIFTGRDAVTRVLAEGRDPGATKLSEVMTANPRVITPDKSVIDALRLMHDGDFRHVPIVNQGKLAGVVSRNDFSGIEKARLEDEAAVWERL